VKKFKFPLDRVLSWRRTQARLEQTKLERLQKELGDIDARRTAMLGEEKEAQQAVVRSPSNTGADLNALDLFRSGCAQKAKILEKNRDQQIAKIHEQQHVISLKERDVKLLEKLREQRLRAWQYESDKEIDGQAEEAFLARWHVVQVGNLRPLGNPPSKRS
jgi:hypothetical protein